MKQTLKILAISALATAAMTRPGAALAAPAPAQNVSIVQTGDLDLTTKTGRQALDHRLVVAGYEVCGTASDADLVGQNRARACRTEVLGAARASGEQLAARDAPVRIAARR
jgi:UrcA family protein